MEIPSFVFDIYKEHADHFISDNFGVNCKIYYRPKKVACTDCVTQIGPNAYVHGGPAPFSFSSNCGLCGGSGYKEEETTPETIKLRLYFSPKEWVKLPINLNIADGMVQAIGFLTDTPKIQQADYLILNSDQQAFGTTRYVPASEFFPHGFKKDRYFIMFFKRAG